ncbi:M48 family metalloprotease [Skermanella rosea]|uniref:M48 family metalloprotease n=1 Tax=Skermanella rosea TaxID=1817965 RepID=UPI001933A590|nr:M48 family metalloprotease [Skermanella rosea]UEM05118.1 M48 family metalloprotease [Skermanella rosea]
MTLRLPRKLVVKIRILAAALSALALVVVSAAPAEAQQRRLQFIRDAEIEHIIRTYAGPIFEASGINGDSVEIALVKDSSLNAFVAGGMNLFIHTGLLQESENPDELIGVIAHEIGHIAGGHLIRSQEAMEGASAQAILSALLGIGAALATGEAGAGAAILGGGQEMARRSYLAYSRAQESTADQAALGYMDQAGVSARGLLNFLEKLAGQDLRPTDRQDAFVRTHPLTQDRIESVRYHVEHSRVSDRKAPAEYVEMHARMKAKLLGFIQPQIALHRYRDSDTEVAPRYGRAIALYQRGDIRQALPLIDQLIKEEPDNPFFHELKGQVLLENSRVAESIAPYRKAVELLPDSALLRSSLAHALVETNDDSLLDEALKHLKAAASREPRTPFTWRLIATVYGRENQQGMLSYALAEEAMARGDRAVARFHAEKAENQLPAGSPGWIRAQDIRTATERLPTR